MKKILTLLMVIGFSGCGTKYVCTTTKLLPYTKKVHLTKEESKNIPPKLVKYCKKMRVHYDYYYYTMVKNNLACEEVIGTQKVIK